MNKSMQIILKRITVPRSTIKDHINSKKHSVSLIMSRHKIDVAMLEDEKVFESEIISTRISNLSWLHKVAPAFPVDGAKIRIIHEPSDFYNTLVEKCKLAKERITFASLYLGTGKLESELVKAIENSVKNGNGKLKVTFLLDYIRGSRGKLNSRDMLKPLLKEELANNCKIFLYHTPKLYGFLKAIIPGRCNELIGLQHMKVYMIDDTLIISGANLSHDYFVNRQDRYFVIEDCKELCDFYDRLIQKVGEFSFILQPNGSTKLSSAINFNWEKKKFVEEASHKVRTLFQNEMKKRANSDSRTSKDTFVFPLIQMGQLGINHENEVTLKFLQSMPPGAKLRIGTGYFNLTSEYCNALLEDCQADCYLLTAHPSANSFFKSKGVAGGIPAAYTKIEEVFYKMCENTKQDNRIKLWEYAKSGWTYHAKGLWYTLPGEKKPFFTLIGSSNFGYRSVKRDLESQIAILTKNEKLQDDMEKEYERLFVNANLVTKKLFTQKDRRPPVWVCATVFLFRHFF